MKIHRFINPAFNLDEKQLTITDTEILNQWVNVLRFKVGEKIMLCDGVGSESLATITQMSKDSIEVEILGKTSNQMQKKVNLYCAILKKENFELVAQKAVEVGVNKIIPVTTDRTIKQNLRLDRLQKIVKEAAEQCGRAIVPQVDEIQNFLVAVETASKHAPTYIFDLTAIAEFKDEKKPEEINIFIGPEGGFSEAEIDVAKQLGCKVVSLGKLVLRGETAAIVAVWAGVNL